MLGMVKLRRDWCQIIGYPPNVTKPKAIKGGDFPIKTIISSEVAVRSWWNLPRFYRWFPYLLPEACPSNFTKPYKTDGFHQLKISNQWAPPQIRETPGLHLHPAVQPARSHGARASSMDWFQGKTYIKTMKPIHWTWLVYGLYMVSIWIICG